MGLGGVREVSVCAVCGGGGGGSVSVYLCVCV